MSTVISSRYARALMNLAVKAQRVDEAGTELSTVADAFAEAPSFAAAMGDVRLPQSAKLAVLDAVLKHAGTSELVATFIRLVNQKRRLTLLPEMAERYRREADERMGRAVADVTVAEPLPADQRARIQQQLERLTGKTVTLRERVDPTILGGVVMRVGSTVWDGSLRNQLNQVRESITKE
jgi:F-type H+-transporting ATPase subunit delta